MKKRILSLILAALTVFALCAPAFAADEPVDEPAAPVEEDVPAVEEVPEAVPEEVPVEEPAEEPAPEEAPAEEPAEEPTPEEAPAEEPAEEPAPEEVPSEEPTDQPEEAAEATSGTCGPNLKWSVSNGTLTISGTGKMDDYMTDPYNGVNPPWYGESSSPDEIPLCASIEKIVIENGVTSIGSGAFSVCHNATSVSIPKSVTSIGMGAFAGCAMTSITIPDGVKTIETNTFRFCQSLTSITIPSSVTSIGEFAFFVCTGLTSVDIPSSVTLIDAGAFMSCMNLTDITIRNPKCELKGTDDMDTSIPAETTIHGYAGSTAETYAKKFGNKFVALSGGTTPTPTVKKGWVTEDGKKYYYQNGEKLKGVWIIDGKRYYFSVKTGKQLKGLVTIDNKGTKRYFSVKTGEQLKGLVTTDNKGTQRYFSTKDGHMMKNGWANVGGGKQVLLDKNGIVIEKKGF